MSTRSTDIEEFSKIFLYRLRGAFTETCGHTYGWGWSYEGHHAVQIESWNAIWVPNFQKL